MKGMKHSEHLLKLQKHTTTTYYLHELKLVWLRLRRNHSCAVTYQTPISTSISRILPLVASMYVLRLVILQTANRALTPRSLINVLHLLYSYCYSSSSQQQVEALYFRPLVGRTWNRRSANSHAALIFGYYRGVTHTVFISLQENVGTYMNELNGSDWHYCSTRRSLIFLQFYGYYNFWTSSRVASCWHSSLDWW